MNREPLECAEIRRSFVAGRIPDGPEVEAHLKGCPSCAELFENDAALGRGLAQAVLPEVEPGELFALVESDIQHDVGLRARMRALPTRWRAGSLIALAGALVTWQLLWRPRPDLATFSPTVMGLALGLLGVAITLGALGLTRGPSAPLRAAGSERLLPLGLLLVPVLAAVLVPLGTASLDAVQAWGRPGSCFAYGAALTAPLVALYWLFERRERPPLATLVAAGALAGTAANLLLLAHCPSAHAGHLLVGHVSIGVVWALGLALFQRALQPAR